METGGLYKTKITLKRELNAWRIDLKWKKTSDRKRGKIIKNKRTSKWNGILNHRGSWELLII